MSQPHYFIRAPKKVAKSRIALFGPLDANLHVPPGQQPQKLKFNLSGGKVAGCYLQPGATYAIYIEMFCEKGAELSCSVQPATQTAAAKPVAKFSVPASYNGPKTQLGYAYAGVIHFKA